MSYEFGVLESFDRSVSSMAVDLYKETDSGIVIPQRVLAVSRPRLFAGVDGLAGPVTLEGTLPSEYPLNLDQVVGRISTFCSDLVTCSFKVPPESTQLIPQEFVDSFPQGLGEAIRLAINPAQQECICSKS